MLTWVNNRGEVPPHMIAKAATRTAAIVTRSRNVERLYARRLLAHLGDRIAHRCVGDFEQSDEGLIQLHDQVDCARD